MNEGDSRENDNKAKQDGCREDVPDSGGVQNQESQSEDSKRTV